MSYHDLAKRRAYHSAWNKRQREKRWRLDTTLKNRCWLIPDLAWVAGVFEGEGCFTTSAKKSRSFTARISMADSDIIDRISRVLDFGYTASRQPKNQKYKRQYSWAASGFEDFQATVAILWKWLGDRRRARAKEILSLAHIWFSRPDLNGYPRRIRRFKRRPV